MQVQADRRPTVRCQVGGGRDGRCGRVGWSGWLAAVGGDFEEGVVSARYDARSGSAGGGTAARGGSAQMTRPAALSLDAVGTSAADARGSSPRRPTTATRLRRTRPAAASFALPPAGAARRTRLAARDSEGRGNGLL